MDTNKQYKVEFTEECKNEIYEIYDYISKKLYADKAARDLMEQIDQEIQRLSFSPKMYIEIEKYDELQRKYRRGVIKNYILLYTIEEKNKTVYVSHMFYGRRNYLDGLI